MSTTTQTSPTSSHNIPSTPPPQAPRHVQFAATPCRTTPMTWQPCCSYPAKSPFEDFVPQKPIRTMSDLDKQMEAHIAKAHWEKKNKLGWGLWAWIAKRTVKK